MANYTIQTGFWVNWEHGPIRGAVVTLTPRDSQVLASFLSAFLAVVGLQLWKIIAFIVHQSRATHESVDGLHRQQQLVWKQYGGPAASSWAFMKQSWAWRNNARRPWIRTIPLGILGACYAVGFALLAIFAASEITRTVGQVRLMRPGNCGYYEPSGNLSDPNYLADGAIKSVRDNKAAVSYADSCYPTSMNQTSATRCDLYRRPYIPYNMTYTSCPFADLCPSDNTTSTPLAIDTGLTDSFYDWGINTPKAGRVQYRRLTTCSPLIRGSHIEFRNVSLGDQDVLHVYANYGNTSSTGSGMANYTFDYNSFLINGELGYGVSSFSYDPGYTDDIAWYPIAPLAREDAGTTIVFVTGNGVISAAPINDPIFNMTTVLSQRYDADLQQNITFYDTTPYITVLACADQVQYCNPLNSRCTSLVSHLGSPSALRQIGLAEPQQEVAARMGYSLITGAGISAPVQYGGGANALKASESLVDGNAQQSTLSDKQWEAEVRGWFETVLARQQQAVMEFATGPLNAEKTSHTTLYGRQAAADLCSQQMTNLNDGSVSYSVLGLSLTVGIGALIVLVSLILETVVGLIQRLFRVGEHRRKAWILDSGFQLHRQLCQKEGIGGAWENLDGEVPVCEKSTRFEYDLQALRVRKLSSGQPESSPFISQDLSPEYKAAQV